MIAKKFILASRPSDGVARNEDFQLVEEELLPLAEGG